MLDLPGQIKRPCETPDTHTHTPSRKHTHVGWHILVNCQLEDLAPDVSLASSLSNAFERLNIFSQRLQVHARLPQPVVPLHVASSPSPYQFRSASLCFWPWPLAVAGVDRLPFDLHTPLPPSPTVNCWYKYRSACCCCCCSEPN